MGFKKMARQLSGEGGTGDLDAVCLHVVLFETLLQADHLDSTEACDSPVNDHVLLPVQCDLW